MSETASLLRILAVIAMLLLIVPVVTTPKFRKGLGRGQPIAVAASPEAFALFYSSSSDSTPSTGAGARLRGILRINAHTQKTMKARSKTGDRFGRLRR